MTLQISRDLLAKKQPLTGELSARMAMDDTTPGSLNWKREQGSGHHSTLNHAEGLRLARPYKE